MNEPASLPAHVREAAATGETHAGGCGFARHPGVTLLAYERLKNDEDRTCTTC